jgi:hypothetical protein
MQNLCGKVWPHVNSALIPQQMQRQHAAGIKRTTFRATLLFWVDALEQLSQTPTKEWKLWDDVPKSWKFGKLVTSNEMRLANGLLFNICLNRNWFYPIPKSCLLYIGLSQSSWFTKVVQLLAVDLSTVFRRVSKSLYYGNDQNGSFCTRTTLASPDIQLPFFDYMS